MSRTTRHLALLALLVFLVGVAAPALASPQPDRICGACGQSLETIAADRGLPLNVTRSTATVRVHENGSATWVVRNRLDPENASRLATRPDRVESLGRRAATDGWGLPHVYTEGTVTVQTARLDNRTLTIKFRDPDAGRRHLGILVVDYLHSDGVRGGWILNTDRFTIVGPPGTTVVNDPRAPFEEEYGNPENRPTVDNRTVTLRGATSERAYDAVIYEDVYIAYGQPATGEFHTDAALALATAPIWLDNVRTFVLPTVLVYALLLLGVAALVRKAQHSSVEPEHLALGVVGLGVLGLVVGLSSAVVDGPVWAAGVALPYLIAGSVAAVRPDIIRTYRGCTAIAVASVLAIVGLTLGYGVTDAATDSVLRGILYGSALSLPVAAAPLFGLAVARGADPESSRHNRRPIVGGTIPLLLAGMVYVPYDSRPWGVVLLLLLGGAVVAAVATVPLAALSARTWAASGQTVATTEEVQSE